MRFPPILIPVSTGCPVGHPSGPGRHCPLCGRAYVKLTHADPYVMLPAQRRAMDDDIVRPLAFEVDEGPRIETEALAMLSSLASDFDY